MNKYVNREISWLDFNARVLQEAADSSVPLLERMRFLGIFSNNLDEFFQVRYATVKRVVQSDTTGTIHFGGVNASKLLKEITQTVIQFQKESLDILQGIEMELKKEGIFFINEKEVLMEHQDFLKDYFMEKVSPALGTIILSENQMQDFSDSMAFLVVKMTSESHAKYAIIEIPKQLDRFVVLPKSGDKQYIMLLDDLIRFHLNMIFSFFNYRHIEAHMMKISRDAELDMDDDVSKSYVNKIMESVRDRILGDPVRLVYDKNIADDTLQMVMRKFQIDSTDSLIPGGRYHRRGDYMNFPDLNRKDLTYPALNPLPVRELSLDSSILTALDEKDHLIYTPYHSFSYVVKTLREAALDPEVKTIKITLYRLSKISNVINSLINAAKNGKKVLVQIELQARFDEKNNINHTAQLEAAGIQTIFGVPGLKVHAKICVIEKIVDGKKKRYGFISTGNFNESNAKVYTDFTLFTSNPKILKEVNQVFSFLEIHYRLKKYKHLIVSPHYTKRKLLKLIDAEIQNAQKGKPSGIRLKLNSITNYKIIDKLYEASNAGVRIQMIVRGVCCLIPGLKGMSENIEVISIVDRFLEHPRLYIFENGGHRKVYLSSADFMTRNIENRVEVATPIYDSELQQEIMDVFSISWNDTVKARVINQSPQNAFRHNSHSKMRSQWATYDYYKKKITENED